MTQADDPVVAEFMACWFPDEFGDSSAEESFVDKVRLRLEWDDGQFDRLVTVARSLIAHGAFPEGVVDWDGSFHTIIDAVAGMVRHPAFVERLGRSGVAAPEAFVAERVGVLRDLQAAYDQRRRTGC